MSNIKCPKCESVEGYKYEHGGRYFFRCPVCLFETFLKLLKGTTSR